MFIPDTKNLIAITRNINRWIDELNNSNFSQLKEALEITGSIILTNDEKYIKIDNVYGVSFLIDLFNSFNNADENEINIHYWEDHGHRIDLYRIPNGVRIVDSNTLERCSITLNDNEFKEQMTLVLKTISQLSFLVYSPMVNRKDYFEILESMSKISLEWKIS